MKVKEARNLALEWTTARAQALPEFAGAYIGGSMAFMEDEDEFPHTSDIDLSVVLHGEGHNSMVEVEGDYRQQAIMYKGVDLEPTYDALDGCNEAEKVLASLQCPSFQRPNIVLDPTGILTKVQRDVSERYRQERWVRQRCESAKGFALWCLHEAAPDRQRLPGWATDLLSIVGWLYTGALRAAVQIPCVANLGGITSRRAYVAAREVLRSHGMTDLYNRILTVCGMTGVTREQAIGCLQELETSFDHAVQIIRTPFWCYLEFHEYLRPKLFDGSWQLIKAGDHREVMPYILFLRGSVQNVIENDAPEDEKAGYRAGFSAPLSTLGIHSTADLVARAEALNQLLPEIMKAAQTIIESHPDIERE
jgi:hypothetical protein